MTAKEIFAEAFRKYGSLVTLPANFDSSSVTDPYDPRLLAPEIYLDYVDTDQLNAMACIYRGYELVAIFQSGTKGAVVQQLFETIDDFEGAEDIPF